ncbi:MAG: DUF5996 family protein [Chloroflexota bacterium]
MLSTLENAQPTLKNLHIAAIPLKAVRMLTMDRQPNFTHLGLKIVPNGLSTDMLPTGGEVTLDYRQLALVYQPAAGSAKTISIVGQTQVALLETLLQTIYTGELAAIIPHSAGESYTEAMFKAAPGLVNRSQPKRAELSDTTSLTFDAQAARDYADAFYSIFTGVARFHTRLGGSLTPAVVWPEHFDLSFLWFAAEPDEKHPHLNFGFAPFSSGIDYPYLYAYAYPYPAQYAVPKLPPGARWNTEDWTGVVLPYSDIARQADPAAYVEESCLAIFRSLRALLG